MDIFNMILTYHFAIMFGVIVLVNYV